MKDLQLTEPDPSLTSEGIRQCNATNNYLRNMVDLGLKIPETVFTSMFHRTIETGKHTLEGLIDEYHPISIEASPQPSCSVLSAYLHQRASERFYTHILVISGALYQISRMPFQKLFLILRPLKKILSTEALAHRTDLQCHLPLQMRLS